MIIYNKKKHIISILLIVAALCILSACNEDHLKGTPFDNGNGTDITQTDKPQPDTVSDNHTKTDPDTAVKTTEDKPSSVNDSDTSKDKSTDDVDAKTDTDTNNVSTVTPAESASDITKTPDTEPVITTDPATPSPEILNTGLDRNEYWDKTFLIWLPMFTAGRLDNIDYAGTYDYATFNNVAADDIKTYIGTLKNSGFTNISIENYSGDAIAFIATNDNSWEVRVTFTGETLVLGSGFNDDTGEKEDKAESLYSTTMLQYVPKFTKGTYVSSDTRSDSTMYSSIVYTDVSKDDVLSYIEAIKQKGYIYVEDEGESDGTIWYIAINDDRFECHVEFSGQELKIGCGYLEDD